MAIERIAKPGHGYHIRLVECPACGHTFRGEENRDAHLRRHTPAEFGLTPLTTYADD